MLFHTNVKCLLSRTCWSDMDGTDSLCANSAISDSFSSPELPRSCSNWHCPIKHVHVLIKNPEYLDPLYEQIICDYCTWSKSKKAPHPLLTTSNQNFFSIRFWVSVFMCFPIIQLKQLTVHYTSLRSSAQEHTVEGRKGAVLSGGSSSLFYCSIHNMSTTQSWQHLLTGVGTWQVYIWKH